MKNVRLIKCLRVAIPQHMTTIFMEKKELGDIIEDTDLFVTQNGEWVFLSGDGNFCMVGVGE